MSPEANQVLINHNFLVVTGDCAATNRYIEELKAIDACYVIIETPEELNSLTKHTEYCGMMVDSNSFDRLSAIQKATIKEYAIVLPTAKLSFDPENDDLTILNLNFEGACTESIKDFADLCATFPARSIRREPRYNVLLNAVLDNNMTLITDISKSGCFIFTADKSLKEGDKVEFSTTDLGDRTPITGLIRRKVEPGNDGVIPGIGVDFLFMTETQKINMAALLTKYLKRMIKLLEGKL